jgi:hypothetical protein
MSRNREVTASFVGPRTLSVTKPGRGAGTVTSSPAGIACGADCTQPYPFGQAVVLTAVAASGSVFEGFSRCDSTPTPTSCRVTMTANRTVDAVFSPPGGVTVQRTGGGAGTVVSDDGLIACGAGSTQCSARYASGTRVRLTASAAAGSFFDAWGGACAGVGSASCEVVATGGFLSVTAVFGQAAALTIGFPGAGSGFVDSTGSLPGTEPQCVSGASCTLFFKPGTSTSLTATPTAGFFSEWGGNCTGAPGPGAVRS